MAPFAFLIGMILYALAVVFYIFPAMDRGDEIRHAKAAQDAKLCTDKGGVPIMSIWDGTLKDCKFKENPHA